MKFCVVFVTIVAVSFGAAIHDTSLSKDLQEFEALMPLNEFNDLINYYAVNDAEFKNVVTSEDFWTVNKLFEQQPEVKELVDWVKKQLTPENDNIQNMSLMLNEHYKPGWKGFLEAYNALIPTEKISNFVQEKVAEGSAFAEFWSRVQGLRPAYERFIRLPEVIEAVKRLEALGFDGAQYDSKDYPQRYDTLKISHKLPCE